MNDPVSPAGGAAPAAAPVQIVRSAEQVALHLPIAGPGTRILAYAIDYLVIIVLQVGLIALLLLSTPLLGRLLEVLTPLVDDLRQGKTQDLDTSGAVLLVFALFVLAGLAVELVYFLTCEALTGGRSIGKAAVGLRVVGDDGFALSGPASLGRNLLRAVDILPSNYLVGLVALLMSPRGQRLGDLAAGTLVVRLDQPAPAPPLTAAGADASYRFSRAQIARLGGTEIALLRQTLRRLEALDEAQTAQVLGRATAVLCVRLGSEPIAAGEQERFLRALLAAVEAR